MSCCSALAVRLGDNHTVVFSIKQDIPSTRTKKGSRCLVTLAYPPKCLYISADNTDAETVDTWGYTSDPYRWLQCDHMLNTPLDRVCGDNKGAPTVPKSLGMLDCVVEAGTGICQCFRSRLVSSQSDCPTIRRRCKSQPTSP